MTTTITLDAAQDLLHREAHLLDTWQFDAWLDLYLPDAEFWMPAWRDEVSTTQDPDRELSLIYYRGRRNLEDRVMRLTSGHSTASWPPARVLHLISNVRIARSEGQIADVCSAFVCHRHDTRMNRTDYVFGRYEHRLSFENGNIRIARKKIILLNDVIATSSDIYSV
ncbi:benzoate/toluate 1,2-dioxygenase beta subunit [Novosphingobium sp. SG751A]|uniref:aromatic-ring-hydroxylating dioxygenase subunit beta n=1 Tax=unclassified Novosphingobium TaxID=2644732 RepID=UPI0014473AC2|nr:MULTISPECIES: aromatic-ring-hydroxylating dioxygenase subunit beta [unclassified Novosphingobium]NKJ01601.1 benzoate/toluate 1,2-dioxygenase beta subunit [Novosphingobium sp. SG707]NOW47769.1 benzoate/toluate 1,2-dioxygenase beta subunit [Novosphingobium sp. SG751A]